MKVIFLKHLYLFLNRNFLNISINSYCSWVLDFKFELIKEGSEITTEYLVYIW